MADYLPKRESVLRDWGTSFSGHLTATPTAYGSTAAVATAVAAALTSFSNLLDDCTDPDTRTPAKIAAKKTAKRAFVAAVRSAVRTIQGYPALTLEQRVELGINPRDNPGTPINAPTEKPEVQLMTSDGRTFELRIKPIGSTRRGKLKGTAGAVVFSWIGALPDPDISKWEFQGIVSRGDFSVELPTSVPAGSTVWFKSAWTTSRGLNGPLSTAVAGYVAGALGDVMPMTLGTDETVGLKQAA